MAFFGVYLVGALPSPERACPDTEGEVLGLGGKSDIMPCNLFLRFSEPGNRRETHNIQSCREAEDGWRGQQTGRWKMNVDRGKNADFIL